MGRGGEEEEERNSGTTGLRRPGIHHSKM